jgi:ATP-dependent Lhr-like helicase
MLNHFYVNSKNPDDESWISYYESLYNIARGQKSIIFSNSRGEVETNINRLRIIAENKKERDIFHVHHGSISADSREYTEDQMRTSDLPLVTGATVTLELGIDLGDLERIVQTGSPNSVSSLAQRLGRSGRRSGISQMCFVFTEDTPAKNTAFYRTVNWQLIKCVALIELYRESWLEPLRIAKLPYNVLFHQTMSILYSYGDTAPELLAQKVLSKHTFRYIGQDDFKALLTHMLKLNILEKTHEGKLLIGAKGEWLTNNYEFYTVFENTVEYSVREGAKEIGSLYQTMPVGERFVLSGKTWEVLEVESDKKAIYVKFVGGKSTINWFSSGFGEVHTKVLQKMREIIVSGDEYGYLHQSAMTRLSEIRNTIRQTEAFATTHNTDIFPLSPNRFGLFPWLGTRALNALKYSLQAKGATITEDLGGILSDVLLVVSVENVSKLKAVLSEIKTDSVDVEAFSLPETLEIGKYGEYVPPMLAKRQFMDNNVDIKEMQRELYLGK